MTTFRFTTIDDEGYEVTYTVPGKYEVCDRCEGRGKHDHPAFENGLTQSDFDEDPDFREDYMSGRYDVKCSECDGERVVAVPDEDAMNAEQKAAYERYQEHQSEIARERAHERRMRSLGIEY